MTEKEEFIARVIASLGPSSYRHKVAVAFADALAKERPKRFNRALFMCAAAMLVSR